jgi:hypothetical protein
MKFNESLFFWLYIYILTIKFLTLGKTAQHSKIFPFYIKEEEYVYVKYIKKYPQCSY